MAMTDEKLRDAFSACERIIAREAEKEGITMAIRDPEAPTRPRRLSHLLWLARNGIPLIAENRREKAMRWLGYLQGYLAALDLVTVAELKDMNRPDGSTHDKERV